MGWGSFFKTIGSAIAGRGDDGYELKPGHTPPFVEPRDKSTHPFYQKRQSWTWRNGNWSPSGIPANETPPPGHHLDEYGEWVPSINALSDDPHEGIPAGEQYLRRPLVNPDIPEPEPTDAVLVDADPGLRGVKPGGNSPPRSIPAPSLEPTYNPTSKPDNPLRQAMLDAMSNVDRLGKIRTKDEVYKEINTRPDGTMRKDSLKSNIGKGLLLALRNIAPIMLDRNVSDKAALGYAIGAAAAGGVRNAIQGDMDERVKLEERRAQAGQVAKAATDAYETDLGGRYKEQLIEASEAGILARETKLKQDAEKIQNQRFDFGTKRLKTLMTGVKDAVLSREQSAEFMDIMGDLVGTPVTIDKFDPKKDTVKGVDYIPDADGSKMMAVVVNNDGTVRREWITDPVTGQAAKLKGDRVKVAEIQAATNITTTGMRVASSEKIAAGRNELATKLAERKMKAEDVAQILTTYDKLAEQDPNADPNDLAEKAGQIVRDARKAAEK